MKVSEFVEDYEYVFLADIEEVSRYPANDNSFIPEGEPKSLGLNISRSFKGGLAGDVDLEIGPDLSGNCTVNFHKENETKIFFFKRKIEQKFEMPSYCDAPSQLVFKLSHLEDYFDKGQNRKLYSRGCLRVIKNHAVLMEVGIFVGPEKSFFIEDESRCEAEIPQFLTYKYAVDLISNK